MATTTASRLPLPSRDYFLKPLGAMATSLLVAAVALLLLVKGPETSTLVALGGIGLLAVAAWMFLSERYEWTLTALMLYLGLADGFLKLKTGHSNVTALRDLLFYSIVLGILARAAIRRTPIALPPLSWWIVAWVVVVGVQVFNPDNGTLSHSLQALRPHLEWVPLFFLGYLVMRSAGRLKGFLWLLVIIAAINGIVGFIQFNLTPEQLSGWGPGYEQAISGEGDVSARVYTDNEGERRTRPFALGGDFGFGGKLGIIAIPAALALLALARDTRWRLLIGILSIGPVLAVFTSEARVAVLSSIASILAFALLSVTSRAGFRTVVALCVTLPLAYGLFGFIASNSHSGSFDRYESIATPEKAVSTAIDYRSSTYAKLPRYMAEIPIGGGFGSAGPASSVAGGPRTKRDAESEATFLVIETGIPGLLLIVAFFATLLTFSVTRIRRIVDHEMRILLTGIAAPLFGIVASGYVGTNTATTPAAPYLWFAAGIVSFWLLGDGYRSLRRAARSRREAMPGPSPAWSPVS